jgi:hypothetical protein
MSDADDVEVVASGFALHQVSGMMVLLLLLLLPHGVASWCHAAM